MASHSDEFSRLTDAFRAALLACCYRIWPQSTTPGTRCRRRWSELGAPTATSRADPRCARGSTASPPTPACVPGRTASGGRPLPSGIGTPKDSLNVTGVGQRSDGTTSVAVNSVLQRANAQLQDVSLSKDELRESTDEEQRATGSVCVGVRNAGVSALMDLLRADAVFEMPPKPIWFAGRRPIVNFLGSVVLRQPSRFRMIPTLASGQPAIVAHAREADSLDHAHGVQVLTLSASSIAHVVSFNDAQLVTTFGYPSVLETDGVR